MDPLVWLPAIKNRNELNLIIIEGIILDFLFSLYGLFLNSEPVINICASIPGHNIMTKLLVALYSAFSLFHVARSSFKDAVVEKSGDLTFRLVESMEKYDLMDYKAVMSFALGDLKDRFVKINVRGKLVTLPTIGSNDSSAKELERILNLNPRYRVHLNASSHLKFSALMIMLNLPVCYDFVNISMAGPYEIARLPLEFFKRQNWNKSISSVNGITVLHLLAEDKTKIVAAARNIGYSNGYSSHDMSVDQYISKDGIFPKSESFWSLFRDKVIRCPLQKLRCLLIDVDYKSVKMLGKVFSSQTNKSNESDEEMFARVAGLFKFQGETMTTFPKLLECLAKRRHSSPFIHLQKCFESLNLPLDDPSKELISCYENVFLKWIKRSLENGRSVSYFEHQLGILNQCRIVFERGNHLQFFLNGHLCRFDRDTWNSLFSKFGFLLSWVHEPLPFFLGYSLQINNPNLAELNNNGQIQDPNEVFSNDGLADVVYTKLRWHLTQIFGLSPNLKLTSKKLADRLLLKMEGFSPVGLLYYTESEHPMPTIGWMTKFSPFSTIKGPERQYEQDLFSRILTNIHKIPMKNYPGLIRTFGIPLFKFLPEPMVFDIIEQTQSHPKIQLLSYYIEYFDVLFHGIDKVNEIFFTYCRSKGYWLDFSPLYAKIFSRFGSQVSEFLVQPEFLKMTWMVVEFFLNLPHETEIRSELMEGTKASRMDIWLWIDRQFKMVVKGDFYLITHKQK